MYKRQTKDSVSFLNGEELEAGEAVNDFNEANLRRIQIREAIKAHLEKEQKLFHLGIKVLSLFFIDKVAKYRCYDGGIEQPGEYAKMFEEEYLEALNEVPLLHDESYRNYLNGIKVQKTHNGYLSIDKKSNRLIDPTVGAKSTEADDVDAYNLILKDKERLLSLEEPVRFIFSHSALSEGWDNPNVFVICTLKHSDNSIRKRQEVGRGLRLCVNQHGDRMDGGANIHDINLLTVVASESYKDFTACLQKEISDSLSARLQLIDSVFTDAALPEIENGRKAKPNPLNKNIDKAEFKALWERINRKAVYTVHFDTAELIKKCVVALDRELRVTRLQYTLERGEQGDLVSYDELKSSEGFKVRENSTGFMSNSVNSAVKYSSSRHRSETITRIGQLPLKMAR